MESKQKRDSLLICLFLVVATLLVYIPVAHFQFINYDDGQYVADNPQVQQGLTAKSIAWAFTATHASNWHPLTWMSHMLDWTLFGASAGGHHFTNVIIHIATTLVLFFALRLLTKSTWRSGFVAALFALHPLHVESVAWVSERKDVLSAFFGMLTILFYARYVAIRADASERVTAKAILNYVLAVVCLALGLLAKQMLVTLPFCLLLMDVWPLQRWRGFDFKTISKLVFEKIPFFVMVGIFIPITIWAQSSGHAIASVSMIPVDQRIENAFVSYFRYFGKLWWPSNLSIFYPYPSSWPTALFAGAALFVLAGFAVSIWQLKRRPFIAVGWCWFVGMVVPVLGLVQVGNQSMADRYMYLPSIGLFIIVAWLLPFSRRLHVFVACAVLGGLSIVTGRQLQYWENSVKLMEHSLAVTERNTVSHVNLGSALLAQGKTNAALEQFKAALKINPNEAYAHGNLARIYDNLGNWEEAGPHYEMALQISPRDEVLRCLAGAALEKHDQSEDAVKQYETALEISPNYSRAAFALGTLYARQKKYQEAIAAYERCLSIDPRDVSGHINLGSVLTSCERYDEAEAHLREAIRLSPASAEGQYNLAAVLLARQKTNSSPAGLEEAIQHFKTAIHLNSSNAVAHAQLAAIASLRRDAGTAVAEYRAALKITPDSPETLNNLAWILATSSDAKCRNGDEAVQLAEKACQIVGFKIPIFIGTLAAGYAEAGNFAKAVEMGQVAYELANSAGQNKTADKNLELLTLYRAGRPYHEPVNDGTK